VTTSTTPGFELGTTSTRTVRASDAIIAGSSSSSDSGASAAAVVAAPSALTSTVARVVVPSLGRGQAVYARVAVWPPDLPTLVTDDLPAPVPAVHWPVGGEGGCACGSEATGSVGSWCGDAAGTPQAVAPLGPVIGTCPVPPVTAVSPCRLKW
jgi:hypothetical protein